MRHLDDRSARIAGRVALVACLGLAVPAVGFLFVPPRAGAPGAEVTAFQAIADGTLVLLTPTMGYLILLRQPHSRIGWLFIAFPGLLALGFMGDGLARHLPASPALGLVTTLLAALSNAWFLTIFMLVLLFPTGQLTHPRWRRLLVVLVVQVIALGAIQVVSVLPYPDLPDLRNPIAVPAWRETLDVLNAVVGLSFVPTAIAAIAQLAGRMRVARGVERQQLKWFVLAASVSAGLLAAAALTIPVPSISNILWPLALTSLLLLPVTTAFAILRHGLFDIDLVINRTLVYGSLSVMLAATYSAAVLVLSLLVTPLTGNSQVAVAVATLVTVALFGPLRRRVQAGVDRRFYRSRYDAARVVARFGSRLRDEVELDMVAGTLIGAVSETVQPTSVRVWLRPS